MGQVSIRVEELTHVYSPGLPQEHRALENISFGIEDGDFVGVIGHTGSGKSTLVQHLNGLLRPTSGKIYIGDKDITSASTSMLEIRKKTGLVFQYPEYQLFDETVAADVSFGPRNLGLDEDEIDRRVREAIEKVGLDYEELSEVSPFDLSGGQKRRIAIAGVIAMKPEILILDEPTAGLDPGAHRDIMEMIDGIHKREGNITILVSHNMNDIARYCNRVLVIDRGHLAMEGAVRNVFARGEQLEKMGLSVPDGALLARRLKSEGMITDACPLSLEETAQAIIRELRR